MEAAIANSIPRVKTSVNALPYRKLYLLCLLLTPINIALPNLTVSVGDFLIIPLAVCIVYQLSKGMTLQTEKKKNLFKILLFFFLVIIIISFSMINFLFIELPVFEPVVEIIKVFIALLYGMIFAFYFAQVKDQKGYLDFLKYSYYGALLVSVTSIIGVVLYQIGIETSWVQNGFRGTGVMHDPNITAIYLTTQLSLMAIYYSKTYRKGILLGIILTFIAILSTASKAAILVLAFNTATIFMLLIIVGKIKISGKILTLGTVVFFFLLIIYSTTSFLDGVLLRITELQSGDVSEVTTGRTDLWGIALTLFMEPKNFFTGIGYGTFRYYVQDLSLPGYLYGITLIHNTFISFLTETGVFSIFILSYGMLSLIFNNIYCIIKQKSLFAVMLFWGVLNVFIGLNEVNLQNNRLMYIFLVFTFFALDELKIKKKKDSTLYVNENELLSRSFFANA